MSHEIVITWSELVQCLLFPFTAIVEVGIGDEGTADGWQDGRQTDDNRIAYQHNTRVD